MVLSIVAGEQSSASGLRDMLGITSVLQADIALADSTEFTDCPGMTLQLDAYARYLIEGDIAYTTPTAASIQFCFSAPQDATGHVCFFPVRQGTSVGVGPLETFRQVAFSDLYPQGAGGQDEFLLGAAPMGSIKTYRSGGTLQLRFAQITADPGATLVRAGSWLAATKVREYPIS